MPARSDQWQYLNRTIRALEKERGLDRAAHQALIESVCNKKSLADCTPEEMQWVIDRLTATARKAAKNSRPQARRSRPQVFRKSDQGYVRKIWGLAMELNKIGYWKQPYQKALPAMVKKMMGVDHPDWLDWKQGEAVIEALKAILERERDKQ